MDDLRHRYKSKCCVLCVFICLCLYIYVCDVCVYSSHVYLKLFQPPKELFRRKVFLSPLGTVLSAEFFFFLFFISLLVHGSEGEWIFEDSSSERSIYILSVCAYRFEHRMNHRTLIKLLQIATRAA